MSVVLLSLFLNFKVIPQTILVHLHSFEHFEDLKDLVLNFLKENFLALLAALVR